ncbi:MAG: HD domain-containing protein [Rubritalea sp.]|jgi:exopolyphosphatase/guanosine-5'-triphosphate,3'-diphosphate pyrophosphatase
MDSLLTPLKLNAAIHIGASSISFLISNEAGEQIEYLEKSTSLAHDIFSKREITKSTIKNCVSILTGYNAILNELGINPQDSSVRIVATNILSEASNKDIFINRLQITCGITVEVLDDGEMTRLIYMKTRRRLQDTPAMKQHNTLVVHAGPGNTRTLYFKQGKIESYKSYRIGIYRAREETRNSSSDETHANQFLYDHINSQLDTLIEDFQEEEIQDIIFIGYEIQLIQPQIMGAKKYQCSLSNLQKISDSIISMDDDDIVSRFNIDYHAAEALPPAIAINTCIAKVLGMEKVTIPGSEYERELLQDIHLSHESSVSFAEEVTASAWELAKKCRVNRKHARQVTATALHLYEELQDLHRLDPQARLLLHCAALLHECGGFISDASHHKHSQYIIQHSDIFGLSQSDIELVAIIARYHRNSPPKPSHSIYRDLDTLQQMRVSKIASLLRIADALDRSHSARAENIKIYITRGVLNIHLTDVSDATVERIAMKSKANLFQNIFGLEIHIHEEK